MSQPLRVCAEPRCPVLVPRGYCERHRAAKAATEAPTDPRYGTQRWRRYSEDRKRQHPFCVLCGALAAGREHGYSRGVTDHVTPVTERPDLFWDETNHRTLCHRCNAAERERRKRQATGAPC